MSNITQDEARRLRECVLADGAAEIDLSGAFVSREAAETVLSALASRQCDENSKPALRVAVTPLPDRPSGL